MTMPFPIFTAGCSPITETIVPDSDISADSEWVPVGGPSTEWEATDVEGGGGDSDAVFHDSSTTVSVCASEDGPNNFRVGLANPVGTPGEGSCQGMRLDYRIFDGTDDGEIGGCVTWRATLFCGTTSIVLDETQDVGSTIQTFTQTLTEAQVNLIDDHDDLRIDVRVEVGLEDGMSKIGPGCFCVYVGVDYYER